MHTGRQFACTLLMSLRSGFHGRSPFSQGIALKTPGKHKAIIYMCTTQGDFTKSHSYDHNLFLNTFCIVKRVTSSKASLAPSVRNWSIDGNTDLRTGETTNNTYRYCVASVSSRVRRESWDESKKKGMTTFFFWLPL